MLELFLGNTGAKLTVPKHPTVVGKETFPNSLRTSKLTAGETHFLGGLTKTTTQTHFLLPLSWSQEVDRPTQRVRLHYWLKIEPLGRRRF